MSQLHLEDVDPIETKEWIDALDVVIEEEGSQRAHFLLETLIDKARRNGTSLPYRAQTAYVNTIPVESEPKMPGNLSLERKIRSIIRWNAQAMVLRASKKNFRTWWSYCIISIISYFI